MALSPVDFAAYSRATGTPYPEDPEERAQLVPEVVEFRRNQLRQPQEGSNLLETLGIAALGLGTLVGAGLAGRRMLRGGGPKTTSAAPGAQLTKIPTGAVEKIRQEGVPTPVAPSKVAAIPQATVDLPAPPANIVGRSLMPTTEEALQEFTRRLSQELPEPTAEELNFPTAANRVYGVGYRERQQEPGYRSSALAAYDKKYPPSPAVQEARRAAATQSLLNAAIPQATTDLTSIQNQLLNQTRNQQLNAVESGEDQMTGRMKSQLSRNEDLDMSQVEMLENIAQKNNTLMLENADPSQMIGYVADDAINQVASQLPDGPPIDQAEGVGYDLRTGERFTFGGNRPSRTGLGPGQNIELETPPGANLGQTSAARFLQQRRLKLLEDATANTPTRLETKLTEAFGPEAWREDPKATRRRNALKLGAAGNEQFFENINEGTFTVGGEQFPVSLLKEGVFMEDTAQALADRVDNYKNWLGNIRLKETNKQIKLSAEIENLNAQDAGLMNNIYQLDAALEDRPASFTTPQQRDRYLQLKRDMEGALERQDELDIQLNQALREFELSERRLAGAEKATLRNIQNAAVPQKLTSGVEEGIVVRPVLTAPDNIVLEEGELSNLERGRPVGEFLSQEQLEIVPGGLLSGGRAKSVVNIGGDLGIDPDTGERILLPNIDVNTGETLVQKLAGKRMGESVGVRGRGGVAGLDTKSSIGIYGPELAEYGTSAMTKEGLYTEQAMRPPTATDTSVAVHKILKYDEEGNPVYFTYPSSYEDPEAYKYTQNVTPESLRQQTESLVFSEKARKGQLNLPKQDLRQYPSSPLARPVRINFPEQQVAKPPSQLTFPSDVVPERGGRVRQSPADIAANQLETYMSKLQRGRSTPLTSAAVIQPRLF